MNTLADKLQYIKSVKMKLRENLIAQGISVPEGASFMALAELVLEIGK